MVYENGNNTFGNFRCLLKTVQIAIYAKIVSGINIQVFLHEFRAK